MKTSQILSILAWVITVSSVITFMHSWHYADLSPSRQSHRDLEKLLPKIKSDFGIAHFITPTCSCSEQVFNHLMNRKPLKNEMAIIVDDNDQDFGHKLSKQGYKVQHIKTKKLSAKKAEMIRGVPLLIIYNQEMGTEYIGGYSSKSITPFTKIDIKEFITKIENNRKIASMPVIGCAVSKKYQKLLDPLGLKYQEQ